MKHDRNTKWMKLNLWKGFLGVIIFANVLWLSLVLSNPDFNSRIYISVLNLFVQIIIIPIIYFKTPLYFGISKKGLHIKYTRKIENKFWNELEIIKLGKEGWDKPFTIIQFKNGHHYSYGLSNEMINELKNMAKCKLTNNN